MDGKNGLLTLAAYLTAALLVALIAVWGVFKYGVNSRVMEMPSVPEDPRPEFNTRHIELAAKTPRPDSGDDATAERRIRLLESLLATKTQRLREQSIALAEKEAQYDDLRNRYDEVVAMAVGYLEKGSEGVAKTRDSETDPNAQLERLEGELSMARVVYETAVTDLELLQNELAQAYADMEQQQQEANRDAAIRLRDELVLEAAAVRVLATVGVSSVPALRQSLNHQDPVVRRWAASMLGGLGPNAADAVNDLTEALSDRNQDVRNAASTALEAIGG